MDMGIFDAEMEHIKDGNDRNQIKLDRYDLRFTGLEVDIA
jgi:hypothetical protein